MKITDVKTFPTWVGHRNQCVVKVETDEGIYGWGEAGLSGRELAVKGAVEHYREFLIGRDPMRIGALWRWACLSINYSVASTAILCLVLPPPARQAWKS